MMHLTHSVGVHTEQCILPVSVASMSNSTCLPCNFIEQEAMLPGASGPYEAHMSHLDLLRLSLPDRVIAWQMAKV